MDEGIKKFDKEYATQWLDEVVWLRNHNVRYVFVKTDSSGITTYKYEKTATLFKWLFYFYEGLK